MLAGASERVRVYVFACHRHGGVSMMLLMLLLMLCCAYHVSRVTKFPHRFFSKWCRLTRERV